MLDKELKAKWVEALRSGKYKQCRGQLRKDDRFCCLGVLCDIADPEGWEQMEYVNDYQYKGEYSAGAAVGLGIETPNIYFELNDTKKKDFQYIANFVESHECSS